MKSFSSFSKEMPLVNSPPGITANVRPSVRLSLCLSVCLSVSLWRSTVQLLVQLLVLKRVAESRRKALTPRLFVKQHQILHVFPFVPPPADLYCHFPSLKDFESFFGSHGLGRGLVPPVACSHVDRLTADFTHVTFLLCATCREACDVLQRHKHAGHGLFTRLHTATEDFKMVLVGTEAPRRYQLPRHGLVEAVEEGLVLGRSVRSRSCFLTHRPRRASAVELISSTFGSFHAAVSVALCKWCHNTQDSVDSEWEWNEAQRGGWDGGGGGGGGQHCTKKQPLMRNSSVRSGCVKKRENSTQLQWHMQQWSRAQKPVVVNNISYKRTFMVKTTRTV